MEIVDSGKDKVKKICDALKKQTLDPAKQEAKIIIDNALKESEKILRRAKEEAQELYEEHKKKVQQEKKAFHSSLQLATGQTLEALKQEIEQRLFDEQISQFFTKATQKEECVAEFIKVILKALEKEGIHSRLEIAIPKMLSKDKIAQMLMKEIGDLMQNSTLVLSEITGGAKVKIVHQHLVLEMTDDSLKALFERFIRDEFRSLLFPNKP